MKIITNVTLYKCDHCKKEYKTKRYCISHEERCYRNPENFRPCWGCQHFGKETAEVQYEGVGFYGEYIESFHDKQVFYCHKLRTFLQSPQTILKGNAFDLGDQIVRPMPTRCSEALPHNSTPLSFDINFDLNF